MKDYLTPIPDRLIYQKINIKQEWIDFKMKSGNFSRGKWARICKKLGGPPIAAPKYDGQRWYERSDKRVVQF
jgi:hypothetical protein